MHIYSLALADRFHSSNSTLVYAKTPYEFQLDLYSQHLHEQGHCVPVTDDDVSAITAYIEQFESGYVARRKQQQQEQN